MSCSPMIARSGASNPCSSAMTASGSAPGAGGFRLRPGGDEFERFEAVLGQHVAQPLARAVAPAGDDHRDAALAQVPNVRDGGVENIGVLVLALGREVAADAPAAIDDVRRARARLEGSQTRQRRACEPLLPFVFGQVEP